tara:strand:- start:1444 stop:1749 length:306 start_codon:yes stop_codon:yes gene_type:complete
MIFLAWTAYFLFSFLVSFSTRNLFKKNILRKVSFSLALSIFITFWFNYPGSQDVAPILSIFIVSVLENTDNSIFRLLRPLGLTFLLILTVDYLYGYLKSRN